MDVGNRIFPMDQAIGIPHFPKPSADKRCESGKNHGVPVTFGQRRQDRWVTPNYFYSEHNQEGGNPKEKKQHGGPPSNQEKAKATKADQ